MLNFIKFRDGNMIQNYIWDAKLQVSVFLSEKSNYFKCSMRFIRIEFVYNLLHRKFETQKCNKYTLQIWMMKRENKIKINDSK